MAQKNVRKCVGIELIESLCLVAKNNAVRLRKRKAEIGFICDDATKVDLSDGTIFYLFNPFGAETMKEVLVNIYYTLVKNPREIRIVYYNAVHEEILQSFEWLDKYYEFITFSGLSVSFWRNS